jgi:hypothetical protein
MSIMKGGQNLYNAGLTRGENNFSQAAEFIFKSLDTFSAHIPLLSPKPIKTMYKCVTVRPIAAEYCIRDDASKSTSDWKEEIR